MSLRKYPWQISYSYGDNALDSFFIPALAQSIRYDRSAGFFSSSALAIAAAGIRELIRNNGEMRLLVGAQLSEADVRAIQKGESLEELVSERLLAALQEPEDVLMRQRLEILAWMVANDTLKIRVVLPRNTRTGLPIADAQDYYHPKEGLFVDADGHQLAFSGSVNESMTAWRKNYEQFSVYFSWNETQAYLAQVKARFNDVWHDENPYWIGLDIPQAARNALIHYKPLYLPDADPLASAADTHIIEGTELGDKHQDLETQVAKERLLLQFAYNAPYLPNNQHIGLVTSAVKPYPHQINVMEQVVNHYPSSYMLCDEVGLGKTIEAGLILRQLLITGRVKRVLLLVPKSVARQWQEELYEKFALDVPFYDGRRFTNYANKELSPQHEDTNAWNQFDVMLASSQLAKRKERHEQLQKSQVWDLLMVDEAHHARRRDFLQQDRYRPNRLLTLLSEPPFQARSVLLMTATPMQVNALEVWDLLKTLGLGGKWGANQDNFLEFYEVLKQQTIQEMEWVFIFEMVQDAIEHTGRDEAFEAEILKSLGVIERRKIEGLIQNPTSANGVMKSVSPKAQRVALELARHYTPLRHYMFRNTRDLLRQYHKQGFIKDNVPTRIPQNIWIPMSDLERELYERIEEYISQFYRKYESKRTGLGFIMTIYRRRLTSSFYAIQTSLQRRLAFLEGNIQQELVTEEDVEQDDLFEDILEDDDNLSQDIHQDELAYVKQFLRDLADLSGHDSKVERLLSDLRQLFKSHSTVLMFTQYTDTMDFLREKLREVYGDKVACYSGRGGETWNGLRWVSETKENIKQKFREGETIKILLCTEAASEGLNLQTCGVLINHDMPWNPMRVEQRIGRIDRLGQKYPQVSILNYFYKDTVEARVYQSLAHRIQWFENVVGGLQPILAEVGRAIEQLAMIAPEDREMEFNKTIHALEQSAEDAESRDILNVYESSETVVAPPKMVSPISLKELEDLLTTASLTRHYFVPHPELAQVYQLRLHQKTFNITFEPTIFDEHPETVSLLTYGNELVDIIYQQFEPFTEFSQYGIMRLTNEDTIPMVAYFALQDGQPVLVENLESVKAILDTQPIEQWTEKAIKIAGLQFDQMIELRKTAFRTNLQRTNYLLEKSLAEQAKEMLIHAALIRILESHTLFTPRTERLTFGDATFHQLGQNGKPFKQLLEFLGNSLPVLTTQHPYYISMANAKPEQLKAEFERYRKRGERILSQVKFLQKSPIYQSV